MQEKTGVKVKQQVVDVTQTSHVLSADRGQMISVARGPVPLVRPVVSP